MAVMFPTPSYAYCPDAQTIVGMPTSFTRLFCNAALRAGTASAGVRSDDPETTGVIDRMADEARRAGSALTGITMVSDCQVDASTRPPRAAMSGMRAPGASTMTYRPSPDATGFDEAKSPGESAMTTRKAKVRMAQVNLI